MAGPDAVIAALTEYANGSATAEDTRAQPGEVFGRPPLTALMQFTRTLDSRAELDALVAAVAPLIRAEDPFRGSSIALSCGTLVEMGGDPGLVFPHLFAVLPRHLALARRAHNGAPFDEDPDAVKAAGGLTYLLLATMAVICRSAAFRNILRADPRIVDGVFALRDGHSEADFVAQVLRFTDGEILVLVPDKPVGFRVALEAVNSNAHLFTLLQAELIGGGYLAGEAPDEEVIGVATGTIPHQQVLHDHARFHFYTWAGLNPDGTLAATDLQTWLSADGRPSEIPLFDGQRVVLIGPALLGSRVWDSNFFANIHDALRSRAEVIDVLPPEQVAVWLERIEQAPR